MFFAFLEACQAIHGLAENPSDWSMVQLIFDQ